MWLRAHLHQAMSTWPGARLHSPLCKLSLATRVTLVEARELLGSFDASLREYAARKLIQGGVLLRKVC